MLNLKNTLTLIEYLSSEMINRLNEKEDVVDLEVMQISDMLYTAVKHYYFLIKKDEAF
ncbi:hypothetical protein [Clostridium intestinale]|uniref:hypothetical protein n=1 Tax=Clostridium intestinale TaxID=36845 RepID=UPI00041294A0|nr:hypothetical protein [Clostridium intestinale]